ncbi:hypothetical protein B0H11DRAFT_1940239 [Mycena galericulata]|nr:hypothetical protein B0H11DRAFT_1940239 [Mycena galericulata]
MLTSRLVGSITKRHQTVPYFYGQTARKNGIPRITISDSDRAEHLADRSGSSGISADIHITPILFEDLNLTDFDFSGVWRTYANTEVYIALLPPIPPPSVLDNPQPAQSDTQPSLRKWDSTSFAGNATTKSPPHSSAAAPIIQPIVTYGSALAITVVISSGSPLPRHPTIRSPGANDPFPRNEAFRSPSPGLLAIDPALQDPPIGPSIPSAVPPTDLLNKLPNAFQQPSIWRSQEMSECLREFPRERPPHYERWAERLESCLSSEQPSGQTAPFLHTNRVAEARDSAELRIDLVKGVHGSE